MPQFTLGKAAVRAIHDAVTRLFAKVRTRLLGPDHVKLPKRIVFGPAPHREDLTLPAIYNAAAESQGFRPTPALQDHVVTTVGGYLDAYEERAKTVLTQRVQATLHEAEQGGVKTDFKTVLGGQLEELMGKLGEDVARMAGTETTRARNMGKLDAITKVAATQSIEDPTVFWVVVNDESLCEECRRLHLLADGVTPRVWKLSQVGHGYHRKGDMSPKVGGCHPWCFFGSMRLFTDRGLLTVKELYEAGGGVGVVVDARVKNRRVGNNQYGAEIPGQVWLRRNVSGTQMRQATAVFDTGVQPCVRIVLESGQQLEVSEEHEIWVDDDRTGIRKKARELQVGDKVPLLSGEGAWGSDHFPELAELMGNLMGDGSIGEQTAAWRFFGDDIAYGEHLLELARPFCSWRLASFLEVEPPGEKYKVPSARFNSTILRQIFLDEFGLSKKPRRVPTRLWSADRETVAAFLRGLYAADGHSEDNPVVVLAQNDREFLSEIQILLANFGLRGRIFEHGDWVEKEIRYANGETHQTERKPCWRMHIGGWDQVALFAKVIGMGVFRKQQQLRERLSATEGKTLHGAWRTARVESVNKIGEHQTYCLTEPMANTVTANGMVVGQCRCDMHTLLPDYGFVGGRVAFISLGHDEYARQRAAGV